MEVFKARSDGTLGSLIWWMQTVSLAGGWGRMSFKAPSNPCLSMILMNISVFDWNIWKTIPLGNIGRHKKSLWSNDWNSHFQNIVIKMKKNEQRVKEQHYEQWVLTARRSSCPWLVTDLCNTKAMTQLSPCPTTALLSPEQAALCGSCQNSLRSISSCLPPYSSLELKLIAARLQSLQPNAAPEPLCTHTKKGCKEHSELLVCVSAWHAGPCRWQGVLWLVQAACSTSCVQARHLCQPWGCSQTFLTFQGQHTLTDEHPGQKLKVSKAAPTRPESMCKQRASWERMKKRRVQAECCLCRWGRNAARKPAIISGRDGKLLAETWTGPTHASTS